MQDLDGFSTPQRSARLSRASLICCAKGGGSGAASEEQKKARLQSAEQFAEQMALMRQQYDDAKKVKTPTYAPASPTPVGNSDAYLAGVEMQRRLKSRFGSAATRNIFPVLGGATPLAA